MKKFKKIMTAICTIAAISVLASCKSVPKNQEKDLLQQNPDDYDFIFEVQNLSSYDAEIIPSVAQGSKYIYKSQPEIVGKGCVKQFYYNAYEIASNFQKNYDLSKIRLIADITLQNSMKTNGSSSGYAMNDIKGKICTVYFVDDLSGQYKEMWPLLEEVSEDHSDTSYEFKNESSNSYIVRNIVIDKFNKIVAMSASKLVTLGQSVNFYYNNEEINENYPRGSQLQGKCQENDVLQYGLTDKMTLKNGPARCAVKFESSGYFSSEIIKKAAAFKDASAVFKQVSVEDCNYAVRIGNYFDDPITLVANFYDGNKIIDRYGFGDIPVKSSRQFNFNADDFINYFSGNDSISIVYEVIKNNEILKMSWPVTEVKPIKLSDLKNNFTTGNFQPNQNLIRNYIINPQDQKSTSVVYDDSGKYTEFKMYDELSWIKGEWSLVDGWTEDYKLAIDGSDLYSTVIAYMDGKICSTNSLFEMLRPTAVDYPPDKYYVNKDKTELKHCYLGYNGIDHIEIFRKVE